MPSNFDTMQAAVFEQAKNLFGYAASWTATDTDQSWSGMVLFRQPTEVYSPGTVAFDPFMYEMEYKDGDFPGLFELANRRGAPEVVTVDGKNYYVRNIVSVWDGKTFRATLNPVFDE